MTKATPVHMKPRSIALSHALAGRGLEGHVAIAKGNISSVAASKVAAAIALAVTPAR